jgi:hypothetical protein
MPHEDGAVAEAHGAHDGLGAHVAQAGIAQQRFEHGGVAQAVAAVVDRPEVPLRDLAQRQRQRAFVVGAPGADGKPAAGDERAPQLRRRGRAVGHELQPLLAGDDVEALALGQRQRDGVALAPVDIGRHLARDGEHRRAEVDAHHRAGGTDALPRQPRDDAGAARDVEHALASGRRQLVDHRLGERPEQRADEGLLVDLGKAERKRHGWTSCTPWSADARGSDTILLVEIVGRAQEAARRATPMTCKVVDPPQHALQNRPQRRRSITLGDTAR